MIYDVGLMPVVPLRVFSLVAFGFLVCSMVPMLMDFIGDAVTGLHEIG